MRLKLVGLAAVAALAVGISCTPPPTEPGDINIDIENTNTNNSGGGGGATPSPSPSVGAIARVGIGAFGESCPPGKVIAGGDRDNQVRVGCEAAITCSPLDSQGREIFNEEVHGVAPDFFGVTGPSAAFQVTQWSGNRFNIDADALSPGTVTLTCTVKGITSSPYTLTAVP
jgi:hypothetical protein